MAKRRTFDTYTLLCICAFFFFTFCDMKYKKLYPAHFGIYMSKCTPGVDRVGFMAVWPYLNVCNVRKSICVGGVKGMLFANHL